MAAVDTDSQPPRLRQHRQLHRRRRTGRRHRLDVGLVADCVRVRNRNVDGDAVRVRRGRAHHRREPGALGRPRSREIIESTATDLGPGGDDPLFGYGLINPTRVGAARPAQPHPAGFAAKGNGYLIVGADGRVPRSATRRSTATSRGRALSAPIVASARTRRRQGLLARRRRRRGLRRSATRDYYGSMAGTG